jgi:hypothetical protein
MPENIRTSRNFTTKRFLRQRETKKFFSREITESIMQGNVEFPSPGRRQAAAGRRRRREPGPDGLDEKRPDFTQTDYFFQSNYKMRNAISLLFLFP